MYRKRNDSRSYTAIDGALLKANASKDSLEIQQVNKSVDEYLSENIKANTTLSRPEKHNRAGENQQHMDGDDEDQEKQLKELEIRYQRQEKNYEDMPGNEHGRYRSNKTHYSPSDPDSRQ
jgi:hypothetical protein